MRKKRKTNPCQPGRDSVASIDLSRHRTLLDRLGKFDKTPLQTHTDTETEEKDTRIQIQIQTLKFKFQTSFSYLYPRELNPTQIQQRKER